MATQNGTTGNDTITGTTTADSQSGGDGNDSIYGGDGADTLNGDNGNDGLWGGTGNDQAFGGAGNDSLRGDTGDDTLTGGAGYDLMFGGDGNDRLVGADDSYDDFYGGAGNDTIQAGSASGDWAYGGDGADSISMGAGDDLAFGGTGNDTVYGDAGNDTLKGNDGTDSLFGGDGNDTIHGGRDSDTIYGGNNNDSIDGGTGSDVLDGGAGNDTIRGDAYNFSLAYYASTGAATGSTLTITNTSAIPVDLYWINTSGQAVYYATIQPGQTLNQTTGATHNWYLTEAGSSTPLELIEGAGTQTVTFNPSFNDTITGGAGADSIEGGLGNDLIYGGDDNDTIYGGAGDDTIYGGNGNDLAYGGDGNDSFGSWADEGGNDTVYGGAGNDSLIGGGGDDQVYGDAGDDSLSGGVGTDSLYGGAGSDGFFITDDHGYDYLDGGADWDYIQFSNFIGTAGVNVTFTGLDVGSYAYGNGGATGNFINVEGVQGTGYADTINASADTNGETLDGMGGNDSIIGGSDQDVIYGGDGNDTLLGGNGVDTIYGGVGNDSLDGGERTDFLYGGSGDDLIADTGGSLSDDTIYGGDGNDTILAGTREDLVYGGAGNDSIHGEAGNDTLYGDAGNDTLVGGAGNDAVYGGDGADRFVLGDDFGSDTIVGGEGGTDADVLDTSTAFGGVSITLTGSEAGTLTGPQGSVTFSEIEQFTLGSSADTFNGNAASGAMTVDGGGGNDNISGGSGADSLIGGTGNDNLFGGAGSDTLDGVDGDDTLAGGMGNDTLNGGAGSDTAVFTGPVEQYTFSYGAGGALIVTDSVGGRDGTDTLTNIEYVQFDGVTYQIVQGDNNSNTTLQGQDPGTPSLIVAHDGNDWGGGHATSDAIFGGAGDDTLDGGDGDDTLSGDAGNDLLRGDGGDDRLFGGDGDDTLEGGAGDDSLDGGAGSDSLSGGIGADTLTGGDGADTFAVAKSGGTDRVTDFDTTLVNGRTADQLDVSDLVNAQENPVTWRDVTVTDDGNGNALLTFAGGEQIVLEGVAPEEAEGKQSMARMGIPCLVRGTRVRTPTGSIPVEDLRAGMMLRTRDRGDQPVLWAGSRRIGRHELQRIPALLPIRIAHGALGNWGDLWLSPQHAVVIGTHLVRAKHLAAAALPGIAQVAVTHVTYHHILLPQHAILDTNGIGTESLYPGPMTAAALGRHTWAQLCAVRPDFARLHDDPETVATTYGPHALPLLGRREALALIGTTNQTSRKGNRPDKHARFAAI